MCFVERTGSELEDLLKVLKSAWVLVEREVCGSSLIVQNVVGRRLVCGTNEWLNASVHIPTHQLLENMQSQRR